ncbi:zinc finger phd-type [Holotrichia oblita]|uniref:Zinc finger phd-type n=1 Tax=Holotrichia oblita TaxID=644536 RepID=A0ACB9SY89_HOLOL|nr:zinc finger phd-type [Holotrichia oblita]
MNMHCKICSKDVSPEKEVACDLCKQFVHSVCSGLSRLETQCLKSKDRRITFYCPECTDFKLQLKNMHTLTKLVQDLRDEVDALKKKAGHRVEEDVYETERVVQELLDRERRKENIVLFNVAEINAGSRSDQVNGDVTICKEVLSILDISLDNSI